MNHVDPPSPSRRPRSGDDPAAPAARKADRLPLLAPEPPKPGRLARLRRRVVDALAALVIENR